MKEPTRIPAKKETPTIAQTAAATILERNLKRYIASCPFECEFNDRKDKKLNLTDGGAEVESVKHIREKHPEALTKQVTVKRKRRVVDDDLELVEE